MTPHRWQIVTGEYPPQFGGVSDYSALVAAGLAAAGAEVHVWAPAAPGPTPEAPGVTVHREAGRWSRPDLRRLGGAMDALPGPRRLLVQYTPNAWGYKSVNLGFGRWLRARRERGDDVWMMVHEAFYPIQFRDKPTRWLLPWAHRLMMRDALAASSRVFVSTPRYGERLAALASGGGPPISWLPVPSNIPVVEDDGAVAAVRARLAPGGEAVVGSFGTFSGPIRAILREVLPALLGGRSDRVGLLLGRGGEGFAEELRAAHPGMADRLAAPGGLDAPAASIHLRACDVLVQPYPEGACTRRGTLMAALAHGAPIVTTTGPISEPIWSEEGCVAAVPSRDRGAIIGAAEGLLADDGARGRLGARARAVYDGRFALRHTLGALLGAG